MYVAREKGCEDKNLTLVAQLDEMVELGPGGWWFNTNKWRRTSMIEILHEHDDFVTLKQMKLISN